VGGDDLDRRKIGCTAETLRRWCREEASRRTAPAAQAADDKARLKLLEREVRNCDAPTRSCAGVSIFCDGGARPPRQMMMAFIDAHREDLGIEPICRELAIAPSSYHEHALRLADPGKRPARARSDEEMCGQIKRVHEANYGVYGSRKVWRQLRREGVAVAKCTVERLMRIMGLAGIRRGKKTITTVSNPKAPCPLDKVNRSFASPGPTPCGWSILPTSTPGLASSMWPS
jgi:hypothetical protein